MTNPDAPSALQSTASAAAIAAHRFGLGEARLQTVGNDAQAWLLSQIGPAEAQRGDHLVSGVQGLRRFVEYQAQQAQARRVMASTASTSAMDGAPARSNEQQFAEHFRSIVQGDVRARLSTAATSTRPFNERLALFWANHFTVSMAKANSRGIVGAYEREAIRPHIGGSFETLLRAAVHHAGMLRYLDNDQSAGPQSRVVQRLSRAPRAAGEPGPRVTGLNENLAREVLELHTLGAASVGTPQGYTQADVTEFARVLTGWRVALREVMADGSSAAAAADGAARFDPAWHDPGSKTVLGRRYAEGPDALDAVLHDLARHPATARFIATKLARHFVADEPPAALVARLQASFLQTQGDLPSVYRTLMTAPEAWAPQAAKLKTPEEFVVSSARLLGLGEQAFERVADGGISTLGQRMQAAPSPAGWPDRAEEWLGPDAVWKRVEWATRVADRVGRRVDARALASESLGPLLNDDTRRAIERAADGPQALALLLLAPEFQRR
jgi:uncharacterized protein (DUF1800 family)